MKKFYLDTSIWRDYFEDRKDNIRPLGEFAFQFLRKCLKEKAVVVVSDKVIEELEIDFSKEQLKQMFSGFEEIIVEVMHAKEQVEEALTLLKKFKRAFPFADILHSIIARDEDAILITRDKHFEKIGIVEARFPEDLI